MSEAKPEKRSGQRWSRVPAHSVANRSLLPSQRHVLEAICIHVDEQGVAYPGQERLSEITGLRRETVCRAVSGLIGAGYLGRLWVDLPSGHRVRGYRVKYPQYVPPVGKFGKPSKRSMPELFPVRAHRTD